MIHQNIGTYCLCKHISKHLQKYTVLCDTQHGFRPNRSRDTQLIITLNDFAECLNEGGQYNVLALDFSKEFDKGCLSIPETVSLSGTWIHIVMALGPLNMQTKFCVTLAHHNIIECLASQLVIYSFYPILWFFPPFSSYIAICT